MNRLIGRAARAHVSRLEARLRAPRRARLGHHRARALGGRRHRHRRDRRRRGEGLCHEPGRQHQVAARRDERGSATIELVILLPALFAVMFLGMQAALFYHARTVAIAAAQEGARAAGGENGKESDGVQAADCVHRRRRRRRRADRRDRDRQPHGDHGRPCRRRAQPERDPGLDARGPASRPRVPVERLTAP